MIKCLTLRQFICPLSLFLKEIPFASLTNAIDVKIESSNGLFDWLNNLFQPIKKPVRTPLCMYKMYNNIFVIFCACSPETKTISFFNWFYIGPSEVYSFCSYYIWYIWLNFNHEMKVQWSVALFTKIRNYSPNFFTYDKF